MDVKCLFILSRFEVIETYWFLPCVCKGIRVGINNFSFNLVCPTTIISQAASSGSDITLRHANRLSIIERFNCSDGITVLFDQICEVYEVLATLLWCNFVPCCFECFTCSGDSDVNIFFCGLRDWTDDFLVWRVDNLKSLAINTLYELVVNEPLWWR